jgi:hypothetical protein
MIAVSEGWYRLEMEARQPGRGDKTRLRVDKEGRLDVWTTNPGNWVLKRKGGRGNKGTVREGRMICVVNSWR